MGEVPAARRLYFASWHFNSPMGFVEGKRKIIYWPYLDKMFEYDLARDPGEVRPEAVGEEEAERIRSDLQRWQEGSVLGMDDEPYRESLAYGHWRVLSNEGSVWSHYEP